MGVKREREMGMDKLKNVNNKFQVNPMLMIVYSTYPCISCLGFACIRELVSVRDSIIAEKRIEMT